MLGEPRKKIQQVIKDAAPPVVGERSAPSWRLTLRLLWESTFRVGDVMNFSWDDERRIHPVWPNRPGERPTLIIPPTQKNGKTQEIPMLPGLCHLLETMSPSDRHGWVVNPIPADTHPRSKTEWFKPSPEDLAQLVERYSNSAIARACGVSEAAVRKWLENDERTIRRRTYSGEIPSDEVERLRCRAGEHAARPSGDDHSRLTKEAVGRVISLIGEEAKIVVRREDPETGRRQKYASAHDLRRGCAYRLINAGVSAETLKVLMRHRDLATTEKFYGATRATQSAAAEIYEKLGSERKKNELVGGLVGGNEEAPQLSAEELQKLKTLLASI